MANNEQDCVLYTRRYFMMFMFCTLNFMQAFQWLQYSIITNIIVRFYDVTVNDVNWTSVICFLTLVPLMIPCTWILEKIGLRNYLIIGAVLNFLSTVIKCMSVDQTLFWVTLFGQAFSGASTPFIQPISAQMARTWFPKSKVSLATGFGVFSMYAGNMMTIITVLLVPNSMNKQHVAIGLSRLFIGQAAFAALQLILIVIFLEEKPPTAPSIAEENAERIRSSETYFQSMKRVLKLNLILLLFVYAFCGSESNSLQTVLNQMILTNFHDQENLVGIVNLLANAGSMMNTCVIGFVLDKFKCHKLMIFICYTASCCLFLILSLSLYVKSILMLVVTATVLGFTINSYPTIIFNFAAELTYPEPEGVSSALCVLSSQVFSTLVTFIISGLISSYGVTVANYFYIILLIAAMFLTAFVRSDSRRKRTESDSTVIIGSQSDVTEYQTI